MKHHEKHFMKEKNSYIDTYIGYSLIIFEVENLLLETKNLTKEDPRSKIRFDVYRKSISSGAAKFEYDKAAQSGNLHFKYENRNHFVTTHTKRLPSNHKTI